MVTYSTYLNRRVFVMFVAVRFCAFCLRFVLLMAVWIYFVDPVRQCNHLVGKEGAGSICLKRR